MFAGFKESTRQEPEAADAPRVTGLALIRIVYRILPVRNHSGAIPNPRLTVCYCFVVSSAFSSQRAPCKPLLPPWTGSAAPFKLTGSHLITSVQYGLASCISERCYLGLLEKPQFDIIGISSMFSFRSIGKDNLLHRCIMIRRRMVIACLRCVSPLRFEKRCG